MHRAIAVAIGAAIGGYRPRSSGNVILDLFDVLGIWFDPADFGVLYQDNLGLTPVTAVEQTVGLALDKSQELELGPELVVDGDFSAGGAAWTKDAGWSVGGGTGNHTGGGDYLRQPIIAAATWYQVTLDVTVANASNFIQVYMGNSGVTTLPIQAPGTYTYRLKSDTSTTLGFAVRGTGTVSVDNISLKTLAGHHAQQPNAAKRVKISARQNMYVNTNNLAHANWTRRGDAVATANQGPTGYEDLASINNPVAGGYQSGVYQQSGIAAANKTVTVSVLLAAVSGTTTGHISLDNFGGGDGATHLECALTTTPQLFTLSKTYTGAAIGGAYSDIGPMVTGEAILAGRIQIEVGSIANRYQECITSANYDAVGFPIYFKGDGVDDFLYNNTLPHSLAQTVMSCVLSENISGNGRILATNVTNGFYDTGAGWDFYASSAPASVPVASGAKSNIQIIGYRQIDGTDANPISGAVLGAGFTAAASAVGFVLFASSNTGSDVIAGRNYGVIRINRALTQDEINSTAEYLAQKGGVA